MMFIHGYSEDAKESKEAKGTKEQVILVTVGCMDYSANIVYGTYWSGHCSGWSLTARSREICSYPSMGSEGTH